MMSPIPPGALARRFGSSQPNGPVEEHEPDLSGTCDDSITSFN
jgi:hypothetical protein